MKVEYSDAVTEALKNVSPTVKKAFFKQTKLLQQNLRHPSLRAKKYDETRDRWQARINKDWRFYFTIINDTYHILKLIPHPKK
jgi:mRNA-degrading endonuclease RelE of RelBE toxin-antitoxin system